MATYEVTRCDNCGGETGVNTILVSYRVKRARPWQADLCEGCYTGMFAELARKGKPSEMSNVRPQHRLVKTEIREDQL